MARSQIQRGFFASKGFIPPLSLMLNTIQAGKAEIGAIPESKHNSPRQVSSSRNCFLIYPGINRVKAPESRFGAKIPTAGFCSSFFPFIIWDIDEQGGRKGWF